MKTTLDELTVELVALLDRYGYKVTSVGETIDRNVNELQSIHSEKSTLVVGSQQIRLNVTGVRLKS